MGYATERFSKRLRQLRETAGLTQEQFAKELGVSRGAISYYEKGERTPDIEFLDSLYEYFEFSIPFDFLLGNTANIKVEHKNMFEYYGLNDEACRRLEAVPRRGHIVSEILANDNFTLIEDAYDYYIQRYKTSDPCGRGYISFLITDCLNHIIFDSLLTLGELNLSDEEKKEKSIRYKKTLAEFKEQSKKWKAEEEERKKHQGELLDRIEKVAAFDLENMKEDNAIKYEAFDKIYDEFFIDELEDKRYYK